LSAGELTHYSITEHSTLLVSHRGRTADVFQGSFMVGLQMVWTVHVVTLTPSTCRWPHREGVAPPCRCTVNGGRSL